MAISSLNYSAAQTVTLTLDALAADAWRSSLAVDNASNLFIDAHVGGLVDLNATVTADGSIDVYAYGTYDGTNFTGGVGGTDQVIVWGTTGSTSVLGFQLLKKLGFFGVDDTDDGNQIQWGPISVASAFGGVLPETWGIVVHNNTSDALGSTGNETQFFGIKYDIT